jgi:hypothetical protein
MPGVPGESAPGRAWLALAAAACVLVSACARKAPEVEMPAGAPAGFPVDQYVAGEGEAILRVMPAASELRIFVYRAGPLARLGHNHIVHSNDVNGLLRVGETLAATRADLYVVVAGLVVDDPERRRRAGEDFATELDSAAIEGTRANMLGERVLDAAAFPYIRASLVSVAGALPQPELGLALTIRDATVQRSVPARVALDACGLHATLAFAVNQSDLGITPFSVLGGALQVQDEIRVELELAARREPVPAGCEILPR